MRSWRVLVSLVVSVGACGREHVELAAEKIACDTQTTFPSALWVDVATGVEDVAAGDVDGDGELDLVTAGYFGQAVGVVRGRGNGTFLPRQDIPLTGMVEDVVLADVDGDGHLDVVAAHLTFSGGLTTTLDVLRNNGDGTFAAPALYPLDAHAGAIAAGDLDEDGRVDVLSGDVALHVRLAQGDGTLGAPLDVGIGVETSVRRITVADVNGDGHLDVLAVYRALTDVGRLGVFLGNGDGTLQPPIEHAFGDASALDVADVNHDGKLDVVLGLFGFGPTPTVALGAGDGTFAVAQQYPLFAPSESDSVAWLAVRDVDHDSNADLLVMAKHDTLTILYGAGDGSFGDRNDVLIGIYWPFANVAADLDHNNSIDLVLGGGDAMQVLLADHAGEFPRDATFEFPTLGTGHTEVIAVGDLDDDGVADLVQSDAGTAVVSLGTGDGTFHSPRTIQASNAVALMLPDLDRDGHRDILLATATSVATLRGHGDGTFGSPDVTPTGELSLLATADLDGDEDLDVVTSAGDVLVNNGNGKLTHVSTIPVGLPVTGLAIADLDHDGRQDVAFASDRTSQVAVFRGAGDATFTAATTLALTSGAWAVGAADLDGDALPELVLTMHYEGKVAVLGNAGGFAFPTRTDFDVGMTPWKMTVARLSSNDTPAFIVLDAMSQAISIMTPTGDGGLARSVIAPSLLRSSVAIADVDGDLIPDLVAAGPLHGVIVRGQCPP